MIAYGARGLSTTLTQPQWHQTADLKSILDNISVIHSAYQNHIAACIYKVSLSPSNNLSTCFLKVQLDHFYVYMMAILTWIYSSILSVVISSKNHEYRCNDPFCACLHLRSCQSSVAQSPDEECSDKFDDIFAPARGLVHVDGRFQIDLSQLFLRSGHQLATLEHRRYSSQFPCHIL